MSAPTIEDIRSVFETDIDDPTIDRFIDDAVEAVESRFGAELTHSEEIAPRGNFISLRRPAASVTSVVEIEGTAETTLASNDYRLRSGGWRLERLTTGTHSQSCWGSRILITYATAESARRWRVIVDLVKLALQNDGLRSESAGDNASVHLDYQKEREALLSELNSALMPI